MVESGTFIVFAHRLCECDIGNEMRRLSTSFYHRRAVLQAAVVGPHMVTVAQRRCRSFSAFVDEDAPDRAELRVDETLRRLNSEGKSETTEYLQAMINKAICQFHQRRFTDARETALDAHTRVVQVKGPSSSLAYFSATTVAHCCAALVAEYERHLQTVEAMSHASDSLLPSAGKTLRGREALERLREEVTKHTHIAERVYRLPQHSYMRGGSRSTSTGWEEEGPTN